MSKKSGSKQSNKPMRKVYNLQNLDELQIGNTLEVFDHDTGETKTVKAVDRAEISAILAYLIGIDMDKWEGYYAHNYGNLHINLTKDKEATIIRYLCRIRTCLMKHFLEVDNALFYELKNIDANDIFDQSEIRQLKSWNVPVIITNARSEDYVAHISELIAEKIDGCRRLFPLSLKYEYIKDLFVIPNKKGLYIEEYNKFKGHRSQYPYQCYIHWKPGDYGYIFRDDKALLENLYHQHGDHFYDSYKLRNASESTKSSIYDFIGKAHKIAIVVDCENSDPFKLCSFIKNMDEDSRSHIHSVILYDDMHTTVGWSMLKDFINVPVDYRMVERVNENKSLVDMEMAVGVTKAYTTENIDSFILCSSDSDFWGLISSLPEARYLVMYEYTKCGADIKDAWSKRGIINFSLDDFYKDNEDELRKAVLVRVLLEHAPDIVGEEPFEFAKKIYREAYISTNRDEIKSFCDEYVMKLGLKVDSDGRFYIGL